MTHSQPLVDIIALNYAPEHTGTAPYTANLAEALSAGGCKVEVTTTHAHYPAWEFEGNPSWSSTDAIHGVRVKRLRHYLPRPPKGLKRLFSEVTFGLRAFFQTSHKPDVTIFVSPALFSSLIASFKPSSCRSRRIFWVQDLYSLGMSETGQGSKLERKIMRFLEGFTLRRGHEVVVIHQRFANYVVAELGVESQRVTIIRNWSHVAADDLVSATSRASLRARLDWGDDTTVVLHAGNMGIKQGLENVVSAAAVAQERNLPVKFVLMGDGSERERLNQLGAEVENLQFLPPASADEFVPILQSADILLVNELPELSAMAVPSKLTSYFAAGRPVAAATDINSVTASEVEASKGGIIISPADPSALAEACAELGKDSHRMQSLGHQGRAYRDSVLDSEFAINAFREIISNR
ncbi:glycosyltransferase [Timonella senegalensis]|uniref:glycosyltransferase n=1 Tax=Timonella senegalensis TaxID=1465825 RepID=UPI0028B14C73|nr:glycosyltransferase [Timonella senegalensis]